MAGGRTSTVASRTMTRSSVRGGSTRVKSSTNSWVRAPPTSSVSAPIRSHLARDRDALADHGRELERVRDSAGREGDGTRACGGVLRHELPRLRSDAGQHQEVERAHGGREDVVERVADHAAGGHDDAVAHARRRAADAVDGAVDDDLVGAERLEPLDGDAELGQRGRAADLDGAVAGRPADDDAAERRVERQLLERLHGVARALERASRGRHERAGRRRDARLGEAGEVVGALAVQSERGEAEEVRAVRHQRVDDRGLARVLDEADDGQGAAAGAGDDVVESADGGGVRAGAGDARAAAAGHRLPPAARREAVTARSRLAAATEPASPLPTGASSSPCRISLRYAKIV